MALFYYMLWRKKRNLDLILSIFLMGCVFMFFVPLVAAVAMVAMVAAMAMVAMVAAVAMVVMVAAVITTSVAMVVTYLGKFVSLHNFALDSLGHCCFLGIFNVGVPLICSTWHTFGAPFRHNRTSLLKTCIIC
jgi:hypothetical protein